MAGYFPFVEVLQRPHLNPAFGLQRLAWAWGVDSSAPASYLGSPLHLFPLQETLETWEERLLRFFSVSPQAVYTAMLDNR